MKLGENILELRKKKGLSQEQLGEKINVTRQTISNWELNETSPNPEQLKLLSSVLEVSIDDLLDNDIKSIMESKISNTEKLAGLILKILKVMGVLILVYLVVIIFSLIIFNTNKNTNVVVEKESQMVDLECRLDNNDYNYSVEFDKDDNIINVVGSDYINSIIKDKKFNKRKALVQYVDTYFKDNGGQCYNIMY